MFIKYSTESEPKPGPVKKKTASRRVVKKKVTLSTNDNIIPDDLDVALELGKSISLTEAEEAEAARKVYATHARIMTEFVPESAKKKSGDISSRGVAIQNTLSAPNLKLATSKPKLKGTGGSSEGTGTKPGVPDESMETDIQEKDKVKAKNRQNRAWNGKSVKRSQIRAKDQ
ncbi:hypothetical protein Tco_1446188, partial [Tanacetum coccineum]